MISLEGLTLRTGRHPKAGWILRIFAHYVRDGLIPNFFDRECEGLYHTADCCAAGQKRLRLKNRSNPHGEKDSSRATASAAGLVKMSMGLTAIILISLLIGDALVYAAIRRAPSGFQDHRGFHRN